MGDVQVPPGEALAIVPFDVEIGNMSIIINTSSGVIHSPFGQKMVSLLLNEFHRYYSQELLTSTILFIMVSICFVHLVIGLEMLDKTGLADSVSPIVMSLLKFSLVIVTSHSLGRIDMYPCQFTIFATKKGRLVSLLTTPLPRLFNLSHGRYMNVIVYHIVEVAWIMGGFNGQGEHGWLVNLCLCSFMKISMLPFGFRINISSDMVMVIAILSCICAAISDFTLLTSSASAVLWFLDNRIKKLLPVASARINNHARILKEKKIEKFTRYAVGLVGTVLFQNFFQLTTFHEVKAFLYLATSWLASLTLSNASHDFGIFNFLLGNVILGSTVNQSGLRITTWFTCCVCLFLYVLRINLRIVTSSESIGTTLRHPHVLFLIFYCCIIADSLHYILYKI